MDALPVILILVLLVGIAIGLVLQHALYFRLRTTHPKALEILDESNAGIVAFQRYLWKRQYRGLGDGPFTRRADSLRRYWTACFLFFLLVIVALVVATSIREMYWKPNHRVDRTAAAPGSFASRPESSRRYSCSVAGLPAALGHSERWRLPRSGNRSHTNNIKTSDESKG